MKRLGQIVVRPGVDPLDPFRPGAARRQHQNRHLPAFRPPAFQHRQAVEARQAEIEDHEVVVLGVALEPGVLAVGSRFHHVTGHVQGGDDIVPDPRFVLDHQNAHQSASVFRMRPVRAST